MHPAPLLVVLALGVDVGWRPLPEGGLEYIIQIEPELLGSLQRGQPIASDVPLVLRDIRRYRIQVGNGPLPQEGPLETPMPGAEPRAANAAKPHPGSAADLTEAPRFVAAGPAAREPAKPAEPAAAPAASGPAPASKQNVAAAETPDPFASPTGEGAADSATPPGEEAAPPAVEVAGPLLAAEAAAPPEDPASTADVPPQLDSDEPAQVKVAQTDSSGAQPTTVHKLTSAPDDDPPLRGGAEPGATGSGSASEAAAPAEPDKPWVWLTLTLMGLAASATVNVYQGFLHLSLRAKYRAIVRKLHDATAQREDLAAVEAGWPDEQASVETVRTAEEGYYEDDEA